LTFREDKSILTYLKFGVFAMRLSKSLIPTLKEIPRDAVIPSHQLMLRAGLIRPLAAGIYSYLPLGWQSALKVMNILREEMNRIGGQEVYLPCLNPISIWEETGRASDFGSDMFRLMDRKNRASGEGERYCLAPTHEEVICDIARNFIKSYRDLPQIWYQIQVKLRDEPRPRSGEMRTRQFIMKDSYTLDRDAEGQDYGYQLHYQAYQRIFERAGLETFVVGASSGLMGGSGSQEFMVESEVGEDVTARCDGCGYSANLEVASSKVEPVTTLADEGVCQHDGIVEVATPNQRTIEEVSTFLNIPPKTLIKTLLFIVQEKPVLALVSGEDEVNESKLGVILGAAFRPAEPHEALEYMHANLGFLGPVGIDASIKIYADTRLQRGKGLTTGANKDGYHITGVEVGRDFQPLKFCDIRTIREGEACPKCDHNLRLARAIEVGHIFKLGTKYSEAMGAVFLNENGVEKPIVMGSYGIGVGRLIATVIETHRDEHGIIFPTSIAPCDVVLLLLDPPESEAAKLSKSIYELLQQQGFSVIWDEREARPGVKFNDADLIGIPVQVIVGGKSFKSGEVEIKVRKTGERQLIPIGEVDNKLKNLIQSFLN
jgi:prolyl-tRNA synthetase